MLAVDSRWNLLTWSVGKVSYHGAMLDELVN